MRIRLKACKRCGTVVPVGTKKCPRCGGTEFGAIDGMIVVFDPERSELAKMLGLDKVGVYAQKVR